MTPLLKAMPIIADLHLHSRYARATSNQLTIPNMEKYARVKGLGLLGTGDAQHPQWFKEMRQSLNDDDGDGIWRTASDYPFIPQTELSLVYTQGGKGRRVHLVMLFPSLDVVAQVQEMLLKHGRIDYDGRPIFKLSCIEMVEELRQVSPEIEVIPAHIWTPWFSMFGSASGFDSFTECFGDQSKHIHAIETGLSSDPLMNWRIRQLDRLNIVSFSDAHSAWPWKLGREATVFDTKLTYKAIIKALREGEGIKSTIEFFPEEGKYHYDGHRACSVCMTPSEALRLHNICPKCGRELTIGVMHRVEQLADRPEGEKSPNAKPFQHLIPLSEIIASRLGSAVAAKKVFAQHAALIERFGNEFEVLLNATAPEIAKVSDEKLAELVLANRSERIPFRPGYDGVFGHPDFSAFGVEGMKMVEPSDDAPAAQKKPGRPKKEQTPQKSLGDY
jgi:uncharacterized protein (TIGR00375 family)